MPLRKVLLGASPKNVLLKQSFLQRVQPCAFHQSLNDSLQIKNRKVQTLGESICQSLQPVLSLLDCLLRHACVTFRNVFACGSCSPCSGEPV